LASLQKPDDVNRERSKDDGHPDLEVKSKKGEMLHQKFHLARPPDRALPGAPYLAASHNIFILYKRKIFCDKSHLPMSEGHLVHEGRGRLTCIAQK
jgi:hypothetical protein